LHHRLPGLRGRAGVFDGRAGHARLPLRVRRGSAVARRGGGDVGAPGPDPDHAHPDARASDERRAAMRIRRGLVEAASAVLAIAILIWSLTPVYNMLLIALDPDEGDIEFEGIIWPPESSLASFHMVLTQGYWLVADFWRQLGNSFFIGLMTMLLTVLI